MHVCMHANKRTSQQCMHEYIHLHIYTSILHLYCIYITSILHLYYIYITSIHIFTSMHLYIYRLILVTRKHDSLHFHHCHVCEIKSNAVYLEACQASQGFRAGWYRCFLWGVVIWRIDVQIDEPRRPGRKFVYLYKGKCPLFCSQGKSCGRGTQQALRRKTVSSPNSLLNPRCHFLNVSTCADVYRLFCPRLCRFLVRPLHSAFSCFLQCLLTWAWFCHILPMNCRYRCHPCRKDRCHRKGCGAEPSFEGMGTKMTLRLWCLTLGKNRPALSRAATSWKWNKSVDVERFPIENVKHGQNSFLMRLASNILSPVLFGLGWQVLEDMGCWDKEAREERGKKMWGIGRDGMLQRALISVVSAFSKGNCFFHAIWVVSSWLDPHVDRRCMETLLGHVGGVSSLDLLNKWWASDISRFHMSFTSKTSFVFAKNRRYVSKVERISVLHRVHWVGIFFCGSQLQLCVQRNVENRIAGNRIFVHILLFRHQGPTTEWWCRQDGPLLEGTALGTQVLKRPLTSWSCDCA